LSAGGHKGEGKKREGVGEVVELMRGTERMWEGKGREEGGRREGKGGKEREGGKGGEGKGREGKKQGKGGRGSMHDIQGSSKAKSSLSPGNLSRNFSTAAFLLCDSPAASRALM
jgi:hypothetical protein